MPGLRAAAIGMRQKDAFSAWETWADRWIGEVAAKGALLVLLPQHLGLGELEKAGCTSVAAAPRGLLNAAWERFQEKAAGLALKHQVYLCPGTALRARQGDVFCAAPLFSPRGELLGVQEQLHLRARERAWGVRGGDELAVFSVEGVATGIVVGTDAWYPEVSRVLALRGADLLLAPLSVPAPYGFWEQVAGMWQEVQQNQVFALEAGLSGRLLGLDFRGRTAAFAPCDAQLAWVNPPGTDPGDTGWLGVLPEGEEGPIWVEVQLEALTRARRYFPVFQFNVSLYQRHFSEPDAVKVPARKDRVRVAAVQMEFRPVEEPEAWVRQVQRLFRQAVGRGVQLVAFPEDVTTPLLTLDPRVRAMQEAHVTLDKAVHMLGEGGKVAHLFRDNRERIEDLHRRVFSGLAREARVWIAGGSVVGPPPAASDSLGGPPWSEVVPVGNVATLFAPDGEMVFRQSKCHLTAMEEEWGLTAGDHLKVVDTAIGRIGIPVCMDATYFETFRILRNEGAELVLVPSANPEPYDFWRARRGIWPRVQESQVYGISSCLVGHFLGIELSGRAAIFAPLPLSPRQDGVLAEMERPCGEGVVVAELDLGALHDLRQAVPLHLRPDLYRRYLPALYRRGTALRSGEGATA
ncbi:MAG TPA: hypothetical protein GX513_09860 [Firmicutes bacterium]|nr:hypothetical protein [Bacillota bacterium]